jgi:hypothetical protein
MIKLLPTKEELLRLFDYDRERGLLIWKIAPYRNKAYLIGKVAGSLARDAYWDIRIRKVNYRAHRMIYFIETGEQPEMLDHINGLFTDNRIVNLRATTNRVNQQNRHTHRAGRLVGASWRKDRKLWVSRIVVERKKILLGFFTTELDAHLTYMAALPLTRCSQYFHASSLKEKR